MPPGLFDQLSDRIPKGQQKHDFFDHVIRDYIRAWSRGKVARVYVGATRPDGEQRSFYLPIKTVNALRLIAEADRVSISHVIRTGVAWYLYRHLGRSDKWGVNHIYGPRPKIRL